MVRYIDLLQTSAFMDALRPLASTKQSINSSLNALANALSCERKI